MFIKEYSKYDVDEYAVTYDHTNKKYIVVTLTAYNTSFKKMFASYFGDHKFVVKTKKEVINNLTNFSQYHNLSFNPEFKHFKTIYYDTENKIAIYKEYKNWLVVKDGKRYLAKTRKEVINNCLNDNFSLSVKLNTNNE